MYILPFPIKGLLILAWGTIALIRHKPGCFRGLIALGNGKPVI